MMSMCARPQSCSPGAGPVSLDEWSGFLGVIGRGGEGGTGQGEGERPWEGVGLAAVPTLHSQLSVSCLEVQYGALQSPPAEEPHCGAWPKALLRGKGQKSPSSKETLGAAQLLQEAVVPILAPLLLREPDRTGLSSFFCFPSVKPLPSMNA